MLRNSPNRSIFIFSLILIPNLSYAYIDPGTGSALVYTVMAILASAYFGLKSFAYFITKGTLSRKTYHQSVDIVFHSEMPAYENIFLPLLKTFPKNYKILYITMYKRTTEMSNLPENIEQIDIPNSIIGYSYLRYLRSNLFVTSTHQLDVISFKRSKHVNKYINIQHALCESYFSKPFSYDCFDIIFSCSPFLTQNLRKIEKVRGLNKKEIHPTGLISYELLSNNLNSNQFDNSQYKKKILIAPTWGKKSLFDQVSPRKFIHLSKDYELTIRPHPQMKISTPDRYNELLDLDENIIIDETTLDDGHLDQYDLLISDYSGIVYEFLFIYNKPVLISNFDNSDISPYEGAILESESLLWTSLKNSVPTFNPEELQKLDQYVENALETFSSNQTNKLQNDMMYSYKNAAVENVKLLESLLNA